MAATWKTPFVIAPAATGYVWVIRIPWFDVPFQAYYSIGDNFFQFTDSNGNVTNIDFVHIFKWRDL
jgi:hypothetical protein